MNNVIYEYHDVSASERLEQYTEKKLQKIFDRNEFVIRADVFFKTENTSSDETGMKCGIRLSAPGPRLFAESSHDTFEEAVDETINELSRQLSKRKEKMKSY
ncbi:ribosome-associated translation inhibitor RaiA [Winogradskyella maritima]|uniref:Ribosome hibernation-promoting factor, HPF/YfiA family n=1 Tax=Winogradskyella maritima TaxID=1517766 RepID=A0ABV8AIY3_9FLAO|nr:ribosome-associated translation inhibitor RaiA [Winogradskyella maritima]